MLLQLDRLNPRQREAVLHREGPLLVLAGAGSGKTSTMTYRVASLMADRGVPASQILGLSFTNKAAREFKSRVNKLVTSVMGPYKTRGIVLSTFHALCARLLRQYADRIGFQKDFSIVDSHDQKDILKGIFRNIRIDDRKFDLDSILFQIGQAKNKLLTVEQAQDSFLNNKKIPEAYAEAAAASIGKYQEQLRLQNSMDFDDLLFYTVKLLEENTLARDELNRRFRYILVDEYQDTNPTQFRILRLLTQFSQNLCVVGDDDQSIYSWRGADAAHILDFSRHYPEAKLVTLDQNYRSTGMILKAANAVIANNTKRHPKVLWSDRGEGDSLNEVILEDDADEAEFVAQEILALQKAQKRPWKDFSILYRSNAQSRVFEEACRRNQIPYQMVGGYSFLDRKEVKDVLAYWKLILNPKDDAALRRIMNWPARGIGKATVEKLSEAAFAADKPLFDILISQPKAQPLHQLVLSLRESLDQVPAEPQALSEWAQGSLVRIGVKAAIQAEEEDGVQAQRRVESAEELAHSIGQIRTPLQEEIKTGLDLFRQFLGDLLLQAQEQEEKNEELGDADQVTLLTLHGAKGLEYPVVFLVGLEEGFLPHKKTIEEGTDWSEERRLCYVGITRARDTLFLTRARTRIRYGKPVPRTRSRFLQEIPMDLLSQSDRSSGPVEGESQALKDAHELKVKDFLANIRAKLNAPSGP